MSACSCSPLWVLWLQFLPLLSKHFLMSTIEMWKCKNNDKMATACVKLSDENIILWGSLTMFFPVVHVPGIYGGLEGWDEFLLLLEPFWGERIKKNLSTVRRCQRLEWWIANDRSPVSWDPQTGKPNAHIPAPLAFLPRCLSVWSEGGKGKLSLFFA